MDCVTQVPESTRQLTAFSTDVRYDWHTPWFPCIGLDTLVAVLKNMSASTYFESRLVIQTAEVRVDDPDAPVLKEASYLAGEDERCSGVIDISSDTAGKFFCRIGVAYRISQGSFGLADVSLALSYLSCGKIIKAKTFQAITPDTENHCEPVTDFIPKRMADKAEAIIIVTGASADFQVRLAARSATTSKEKPNAWSTALDTWHNPSGANGEYNTGEITLSYATDMYVQLGAQHSLSTGSNGGATVTMVIAVRKTAS